MAWINFCNYVAKPNGDGVDGFELMVYKHDGHTIQGEMPPDGAEKFEVGPFYSIHEAVRYCRLWDDAKNPPAVPPHADLLINGCVITAKAQDSAKFGYVSTVTRQYEDAGVVPIGSPIGTIAEPVVVKVDRGPFETVKEAIEYSKQWNDPRMAPAMPKSATVEVPANKSGENPELPKDESATGNDANSV